MPLVGALLASAWGLGVLGWFFFRSGEVDGFSGIGAAYAVSELVGLAVSRDSEWFLLSPVISDWVLGGVFLVSMLLPRPLIQVLAEQMAGQDAFSEHIRKGPHYHPLWLRLSLVWGLAYVAKGVLAWIVLATSSTEVYLTARVLLGWPVVACLVAFSWRYPRWYWQRVA